MLDELFLTLSPRLAGRYARTAPAFALLVMCIVGIGNTLTDVSALTLLLALGVMVFNFDSPHIAEQMGFVLLPTAVLLTLLVQRNLGGRDEEKGSWTAVQAIRPVPEALRQLWPVRNLGLLFGFVCLAVAALVPLALFVWFIKAVTRRRG